jgi:hypothetical protein
MDSQKGYVFEINAGWSQFIKQKTEVVGRGGITLGYRLKHAKGFSN